MSCRLLPLTGAVLLISGPLLHADSIGVNFLGDSGGQPVGTTMASGASAGVVAQTNWNNPPHAVDQTTPVAVNDDSGSPSGASITWDSNNTWRVPNNAGSQPLMDGYLDSSGGNPTITVTVTGISYASYDVYVYVGSDGNGRTGRTRTNSDVASDIWHRTNTNPFPSYIEGTSTTEGGAISSNYARYADLSGSTLTIQTLRGSNNFGFHGFQIVETVPSGKPTVDTLPAQNVTATSARIRGDLVDIGTSNPVAKLFWGPVDGVTDSQAWANEVNLGTLTSPQVYFSDLTGLLPGTDYFFRAYAENNEGGDWAGTSEMFTTLPGPPTVANVPASDVEALTAKIGAQVVSDGGEAAGVIVFYGTTDGGTNPGSWSTPVGLGNLTTGQSAEASLTGLTPATTYYFRAFGSNTGGQGWAPATSTFTTPALTLPSVVNQAATSITGISAKLNGEVTNTGGDPPDITFYFGKTDGESVKNDWDQFVQIGVNSGSFSRTVGNLDPLSTYYFRALAENTAGEVWASPSLSFQTPAYTPPTVVINELHIDEEDKTKKTEFIELYNNSGSAIDISGWYFSQGINQPGPQPGDPDEDYTFPPGTSIPANDYLVIAQDPTALNAEFGYAGALGPWVGSLKNSGETVRLKDVSGNTIDEVDYQLGWPWPTYGDPPSPSMELINPNLDNDLGGSWRSSGNVPATGGAPANFILRNDAQWHYRKGFTFPANDGTGKSWIENGYDESTDGQWLVGQAPIGYGDGDDNTVLGDMQNGYKTAFLRHEFTIAAGQVPPNITLRALYDDGLVVWINGVEVHRFSVDPGVINFPPPDGFANSHEASGNYEDVTKTGASAYLVEGTNTIAVQLINTNLSSSDATADVELVYTGGAGGGGSDPTPGAVNTVFASNGPPAMRQVDHTPNQPTSVQDVTITVKVTDTDGVASVNLDYQLVDPGDYIKISDPRYNTDWTTVAMVDDGTNGDLLAGDDVFSVLMPAALQTHRRLVRYRITAVDGLGASVTGPYSDDPQPNFAYFVYDGIPSWTGKATPSDSDVVYNFNTLPTLQQQVPVYHLITTREEHEESQHIPNAVTGSYGGSDYLWEGTLVYDGDIYDHIRFRARGGVWRYSMGKNMWKFDFNRGHRFEARDNYGKKYDAEWSKLNFSALIQQGNFGQRGEQGLFEWGGFKLHNLTGNDAPETHFIHFRIVEHANENGPTSSQFDTDFQGLYLAVEQLNGQFLDGHDLPDGYLWKIEGNNNQNPPNNQGPYLESDYPNGDVDDFINAYRNGTPTAQWWMDNLDLEDYYSFRAIATAVHDYDIHAGKNYFFLHDPTQDKWRVINWDLDLTWTTTYGGGGINGPLQSDVLGIPEFATAYRNRMREILDLVFNNEQTGKILDECARFVHTPGMPSLVDADRAMWDYNPILVSSYINSSKAGHGRYYEATAQRTFAAMLNHVKGHVNNQTNFINNNSTNLQGEASIIPTKPTISYVGSSGFAANDLTFQSSTFADPQGAGTFAAMQWRIGEIYYDGVSNYVAGDPYRYEIEEVWTSSVLTSFTAQQTVPIAFVRPGRTYRARVRHQDADGNWSHWSNPVEFLASAPDVSFFQNGLVISEFMYHPADATPAEQGLGFSNSHFEWIELRNVGQQPVDMTNVRFTKGVDFDFPNGYAIPVGGYVIIARNQDGFEHRHGTSHPVVGEYTPDNLSNGGENFKLSYGAGPPIIEFVYEDKEPWPEPADGDGFSLVLIDPESLPDHSIATNWRISQQVGGSPGTDDALTFNDWKTLTGVVGSATANDDDDDLDNLSEYALGSSGTDASSANVPEASVQPVDVGGVVSDYLVFSFRKRIGADDLTYIVEYSTDLENWEPLDAVFMGSVPNGDGTTTETWRGIDPNPPAVRYFVRMRVIM